MKSDDASGRGPLLSIRCGSLFVLAVALLLGAAATIPSVIRSPLGIDEQVTYYIAAGANPSSIFSRAMEQSATPPLYFYLARVSLDLGRWLFGDAAGEAWLRLPSLLAYFGSIVAAWLVGERCLGRGVGLGAALLLACQPELIGYALVSRPYTLGVLASIGAFGLTVRLRQTNWNRLHLIGWIACNLALIWSHYLFAILIPIEALLVLLLVDAKRPANPGRVDASDIAGRVPLPRSTMVVALVAIAFSAGFLLLGAFRLMHRGKNLNWLTVRRPLADLFDHLPWMLVALVAVGGWVVARVGLGVFKTASDQNSLTRGNESQLSRRRIAFVLAGWYALPILSIWLASVFLVNMEALTNPRYVLIQIAPAVLLAAWLLHWAAGQLGLLLVAVVLAVNGNLTRVWNHIIRPPIHDSVWKDAAILLNQDAIAGDVVFVQTGLVETHYVPLDFANAGYQEYTTSRLTGFYYRSPARCFSLPNLWRPLDWLDEYSKLARQAVGRGGRVWLVISADIDIGEAVEAHSVRWLEGLGLEGELLSDNPIGRVRRFTAREKTGLR